MSDAKLPLCQELTPRLTWSDLCFPERVREQLMDIPNMWKARTVVHAQWGIAKRLKSSGMTILFAGPSGTGKTETASVIAGSLGLRPLLVNTSALLSKYIGETEHNIASLLDAAQRSASSVALIFDECDTLFAKRIEQVRGSGDVAHNSHVGVLLSRLERFDGLAVLTTNAYEAIDRAFRRRFLLVVRFPEPTTEIRRQVWHTVMKDVPAREDIDFERLAKLELSPGAIQNAFVRAAYVSAARGLTQIDGAVLLTCANDELEKEGKLISSPRPALAAKRRA